MKICIALHQCMDLGGIINHTEQLAGGLKDLGHQVTLLELVYADDAHAQRKEGLFETGPTRVPFAQGKGWNFPRPNRIPYKTSAGLSTARLRLSEYDMIIWTVPVPSKNKQNLGNNRWPELYNLPPHIKQIAISHDGNAEQGYPHILAIEDKLTAVACVHGAAFGSTKHLNIPRKLIVNPQANPVREVPTWDSRRPGFVNMQTFKAWKHVHELVEAIRYMKPKGENELREIAGMGIEYRYMVSEEKCKPQYFHDDGVKFWDAALENGMVHHDYWNNNQVNFYLEQAKVLVDPSWSKKYSKYGGHWNRVAVDAMIRGAVPVANSLGMGADYFIPDVHYVDLNAALDAEDYAAIIEQTWNMDKHSADQFRDAALELLPNFDRKRVAQQFIDLAHGETDVAQETNYRTRKGILDKADKLLFDHFGILL